MWPGTPLELLTILLVKAPAGLRHRLAGVVTWRKESTWHVIYRPIKTRPCRAVIYFSIVWHQVSVANLGQKWKPGSVVSRPFWSHHKLPLHVGEREGSEGVVLPPPIPHCPSVRTHAQVSLICVQCCRVPVSSQALCESGVQIGVTDVVTGERRVWQRGGLSRSLRLLTGPARVWSPPFHLSLLSGVFVCCVAYVTSTDQVRQGQCTGGYQV